jgi:hypothetical protein
MAFNFGGFMAGVSEKIVERVETEEDRLAEIAKEQRLLSNRLAFDRQSERRKKKAAAEELASELSVYFSPKETEAILGKGQGAAKQALLLGQSAFAQGKSASPILNLSSAAELTEEETADFANKVISGTDAAPLQTGAMSDSLEAAQPVTGTTTTTAGGGLFNAAYVSEIMAPADEEQATLDSAYAVAVQQSLTEKTEEKRNERKKLAAQILIEIKKKDAALAAEDTDSSPFSKSSIEGMQKTQMKIALEANDFAVDMEGRLAEKIGNKVPQYNVAVIQANSRMRTLNTGEDGLPMSPQLHSLTGDNVTQAIKKIQLDARQQHASPSTTAVGDRRLNPDAPFERFTTGSDGQQVDVLQQNAQQGKYKIGDIVYTTIMENGIPITRLQVYTGIQVSSRHNNFIDAGKI